MHKMDKVTVSVMCLFICNVIRINAHCAYDTA